MRKKLTYRTSTHGLNMTHDLFDKYYMIRIEIYSDDKENIILRAVSAHNLSPLACKIKGKKRPFPDTILSKDEYNKYVDNFDCYDIVGSFDLTIMHRCGFYK